VGGLTGYADTSNIRIVRQDGTTVIADMNKIVMNPETEINIHLMGGDTIYVPTSASRKMRVVVLGQVAGQGVYTLDVEHSKVIDAISESGGAMKDADLDQVSVTRNEGGEKKTITLKLKSMNSGAEDMDFQLLNDDVVYVPSAVHKKKTSEQVGNVLKNVVSALNAYWLMDRMND
jgi:protein involved in polysaccharide export with SLBB domain